MFTVKERFEHILQKLEMYKDTDIKECDLIGLCDIIGCCLDIQEDIDGIKELVQSEITKRNDGE